MRAVVIPEPHAFDVTVVRTALLRAAAERGCRVQPGLAMLTAQRDLNLARIGHLDSDVAET